MEWAWVGLALVTEWMPFVTGTAFESVRGLAMAFESVAALAWVTPTGQVLQRVQLASEPTWGKPTTVQTRREDWGLLARLPLDSRRECHPRKDRSGPMKARCSAPEGASQQSDLPRSV